MTSVTVRVPAKINLHLAVGGPRPDGFHDVATVYQAVSLYDEVTVTPADALTVEVAGAHVRGVPDDAGNLAARAASVLARRAGLEPRVHLRLVKGIPVAGGMAGGSADAAAALLACDALWGCALPREQLIDLAAELGSDVPFALVGGTAVGNGRGERLTPALTVGRFAWVLGIAEGGLSTPAVYAETDRLRSGRVLPEPRVPDAVLRALRAGDASALGRALGNDLQPAACSLRPQLSATLAVGQEHGALGCLVSGSGPTCAFLTRDDRHAEDLAAALASSGTCADVARAYGPVPGAQLLPHEVA
ncbi:MAG: 4-(cytidine 5'-diphospho)-2-C-methyl-D-erythritol kinase [Actinomycetota bacterium]|nr:4-(cytidine 5'-diphospho)-2-C-methyl-D-erythritol kinase [Actinomycetota bacterium]